LFLTIMTVANNPEANALLAHVVSQVQQNVEFLVSQNYLPRSDASAFLSKLNNVSPGAAAAAPRSMAKALWNYNEDGSDAADLSFSAGDMIEIIEETNPDWWTGKVNGRQALFPSSYVEKVASPAPVAAPFATMPTPVAATRSASSAKPYRPFGAAHQSVNAPPPNVQPMVNNVGLQADTAGQEQKKSKYGKYGNTMAHSAAGGVGFGAGSAIGGGLVRAIF